MVTATLLALMTLFAAVPPLEAAQPEGAEKLPLPVKAQPSAKKTGPQLRSKPKPEKTKPALTADERLILQNRDFLKMLEMLMDLPLIADDSELESKPVPNKKPH